MKCGNKPEPKTSERKSAFCALNEHAFFFFFDE